MFLCDQGPSKYSGKVLKLAPYMQPWGQELITSVILAEHALAPRTLAWGRTQEKTNNDKVVSEWRAWIVEPAMSLEKKIKNTDLTETDTMRYLLKAVITMLQAFLKTGLVLSDNGLCNFGVTENDAVLIIDPGSRTCDVDNNISKKEYRQKVMTKFWGKKSHDALTKKQLKSFQPIWSEARTIEDAVAKFANKLAELEP